MQEKKNAVNAGILTAIILFLLYAFSWFAPKVIRGWEYGEPYGEPEFAYIIFLTFFIGVFAFGCLYLVVFLMFDEHAKTVAWKKIVQEINYTDPGALRSVVSNVLRVRAENLQRVCEEEVELQSKLVRVRDENEERELQKALVRAKRKVLFWKDRFWEFHGNVKEVQSGDEFALLDSFKDYLSNEDIGEV